MEDSFFMQDNSEGNHGTEAILDFQMSWLLRLVTNADAEEKLRDISLKTIGLLLGLSKKIFTVEGVRVWRQWHYIDVKAEVTISIEGRAEHHLIIIENKVYQRLRKGQLDKYSQVVKENYGSLESPFIHYWLVYGSEKARR